MKKKTNYNLIISTVVLMLVIAFTVYIFLYKRDVSNFKLLVLNIGILIAGSILSIIYSLKMSRKSQVSLITSIIIVIFGICTFFIIKEPNNEVAIEEKVPNFVGKNISEAISWATSKNIEVTQNYEYSDSALEYIVFAQDIVAGTNVSDVTKLTLTISNGFNYDKMVILPSFIGQKIDAFLAEADELHLNNIIIDYQVDDYNLRDTIMKQNVSGEVRRNDEVKVIVSLGKKSELSSVNMISLIGKSLFDAKLYLEQNGINYEVKYEFSDTAKDTIIAQSVLENELVKPFDTKVIITASKGNKIIVPNLLNMSIDEITKWITDNNLKISLSDEYSSKVEVGSVISANYKENDEISEGTTINIVTSKGSLKMPSFKNLNEFRTWANKYNIDYDEEYEFSNSVPQGSIIKFSLSPNDIIDVSRPIIVTISSGKSIVLPNFVGKTKTEITNSCKNIALNCNFSYDTYSSIPKDTAVSQSKKAGSTVISGTSLTIYLSKGIAKTFTVEIYESQLTFGNASETTKTLKNYFANNYPGVTFVFSTQKTNVFPNAGYIHENSEVKDGTKVTQGKSYKVIITTK